MKIIFMGTPEFALFTLKKLVEKHDVIAVYSQPPRPAGRGQKEKPSPVHNFAEENNIPVYTPLSLKSTEEQQKFIDLNADVAVVSAYGLLLPSPILNGTKYGCLNIHPSLLPRWRGAAPIQRPIIDGDEKTGICIMQMDEGMDTGDILKMREYPITKTTTAGELHDELGELGADMMLEVLDDISPSPCGRGEKDKQSEVFFGEGATACADITTPQAGSDNIYGITRTPQSDEGATYAKKISKTEAKIDWNKSAEEIDRLVRGLNPYPAAYFDPSLLRHCEEAEQLAVKPTRQSSKIKIYRVEVLDLDHNKPAGSFLDDKLTIACGKGAVRILELQKSGKKVMTAEEFLRGNKIN